MTLPDKASAQPRNPPLYLQAQQWLTPALENLEGFAIDGTCGNGNDLLFLCKTTGRDDRIIGVDIQPQAIEETRRKLEGSGYCPRLFQINHADLRAILEDLSISPVSAAIFNLGYLPGGDHSVITQAETTISALESIFGKATPSFRLAVVAYRGHPGGREESDQVRSFLQNKDPSRFAFSEIKGDNPETGPVLYRLNSFA